MKWIDIPQVWFLGAIVLTWILSAVRPFGLSLDFVVLEFIGGLLVGGGIIVMLLAVAEMRKRQTTVIPRQEAETLVTSGIFKRSRNPIYLGDAMILTGIALFRDAPFALVLVPIFIWTIEKRFIEGEENMLRRKFSADFARYEQKTRRWV